MTTEAMNGTGERIRALLEGVVRELVDHPEGAKVEATIGTGGRTIVLTVGTGAGDLGKVIGKKGRTAEVIRYLLEAMAARHRVKIVMEIDDQRKSRRNKGNLANGATHA
jgi:predicted RNA-binding protein YlqC (UPF0109 family)